MTFTINLFDSEPTFWIFICFSGIASIATAIINVKTKKLASISKRYEILNDRVALFYIQPMSSYLLKSAVDVILTYVNDNNTVDNVIGNTSLDQGRGWNCTSSDGTFNYEYAVMRQKFPELNQLFLKIERSAAMVIVAREGGRPRPSRVRCIRDALQRLARNEPANIYPREDLHLVLDQMRASR